MNKINKKQWIVKIGIVMILSFCIAYFIDQYYIKGRGSSFLIQLFKL